MGWSLLGGRLLSRVASQDWCLALPFITPFFALVVPHRTLEASSLLFASLLDLVRDPLALTIVLWSILLL